jgi:hypothetical protein
VLTRRRIGARALLAFSGLVQKFLFVRFSGMGLGAKNFANCHDMHKSVSASVEFWEKLEHARGKRI